MVATETDKYMYFEVELTGPAEDWSGGEGKEDVIMSNATPG